MKDYAGLRMPGDILNAALRQEKELHDFYSRASANCKIDSISGLLEKLKDDGYRHIRMIEGVIAQLGMG